MGATFVDCSFDTSSARLFFDRTLKPFFDRHIRLQTLSDHPNTTLTELFHAAGCQQHDVVKNADGSKVRYGGELRSIAVNRIEVTKSLFFSARA